MTDFAHRLACIRSGQLTDEQIAAEMRDREFARYWWEQVSHES